MTSLWHSLTPYGDIALPGSSESILAQLRVFCLTAPSHQSLEYDWKITKIYSKYSNFPGADELTHLGRKRIAPTSQTFTSAFSLIMKMYEFRLRYQWGLFLSFEIYYNIPTLVQIMAWRRQVMSHHLNLWWPKLPTHISVTRPQWVKCSELWRLCEQSASRSYSESLRCASYMPYGTGK